MIIFAVHGICRVCARTNENICHRLCAVSPTVMCVVAQCKGILDKLCQAGIP